MKKCLLFITLLLAATLADAVAQSRPYLPKHKTKGKYKPPPEVEDASVTAPAYVTKASKRAGNEVQSLVPALVGKVKLKDPVLVYYQEPAPGKCVQQLVMAEENIGLLKTLDLEELMNRREVFVDGLGNLPLPGRNDPKYRLLGASAVVEKARRPVGDGRSFYSRLRVPAAGALYVVRESAEAYRHFVKGAQNKGALLDFQANGLPGIDSVRAVYTVQKMNLAEPGAGSGATVR